MNCLASVKSKYILVAVACCLIIGLVGVSAGLGINNYSSKTIKSKTNALLRTQSFTSQSLRLVTVKHSDVVMQTLASNNVPDIPSPNTTSTRSITIPTKTTKLSTTSKIFKARTKKGTIWKNFEFSKFCKL